jgi:hypothetical protein
VFLIRENEYSELMEEHEWRIAGLVDSLNIQFVVVLCFHPPPLSPSGLPQHSLVYGSSCGPRPTAQRIAK